MTDPDFNLCREAEFPRFHHLSDSRLCLFLSKGGWQTPWNNPRTLTSARPTVTSQETNGWSKEGQRKLERQRDRKQVAVEQRRWGKNCDWVRQHFLLIFLKSEKMQVWVRGASCLCRKPHLLCRRGEEYAIPVWLKTAACVVVWGCFRYSRQGGEHTHTHTHISISNPILESEEHKKHPWQQSRELCQEFKKAPAARSNAVDSRKYALKYRKTASASGAAHLFPAKTDTEPAEQTPNALNSNPCSAFAHQERPLASIHALIGRCDQLRPDQ